MTVTLKKGIAKRMAQKINKEEAEAPAKPEAGPWPPTWYCCKCGGPRMPNWLVKTCAHVSCGGEYVATGQHVDNVKSILPMPKRGYRTVEESLEFLQANNAEDGS